MANIITTKGVVLRTYKYGETSLIVEIFTAAKGLKKYAVSGVRKPKSRMSPSLFQVMSLVEVVVYDQIGKDLNRLKEIRPIYIYNHLLFDVKRGAVGMFIAEVSRKCFFAEEEDNHELFDFLYHAFIFLDQTTSSIANIPIAFLFELSQFLGFYPEKSEITQSAYFDLLAGVFSDELPRSLHFLQGQRCQIFAQSMDVSIVNAHLLELSYTHRQQLLNDLILYYRLHIEYFGVLNTPTILNTVFE